MSPHRRQSVKPATSSVKWAAQWISVTTVSYIALILALGTPYIFGHQIHAGEKAERNYAAHEKTRVIDRDLTHQAQDAARASMLPVFKRNETASRQMLSQLKIKLDELQKMEALVAGGTSPAIVAANHNAVDPESTILLLVDPKAFPAWRTDTEFAVHHYLSACDLLPESNRKLWQIAVFQFLPDKFPTAVRTKTAELATSVLRPNITVDVEATQTRAKERIAQTKPITREIETGALLIQKGEILTPEDVTTLRQMGITHTYDIHNLVGVAVALFAAFFLFGLFLFTYEPQYFYSPSAIALMATVCVVTCGIAAAVGRDFPQFVSLPATALVLTVVFGRRVSIILALLVIVFLRVTDLVDSAHLVALTAATGVALSVNISRRKELMLAGVMIGVVQAVGYFSAVMFGGMPESAIGVGRELAQNLLGGLSSSIVGIGSLPFLEIIFGVLTPFRVAELSEPDQPLLRQLEENAPGTYQHSLAVANLAEAGAKAVGADVNLVRAGAMYHDIGKMVTPRFFIENQLGDRNPHDEIAPEESRAKVLAHVTNGLDLARKYGLPKRVLDFIPEHQGTTIMAYFYHKACVRDGVENVSEQDYRYPGPKPQCRETAIVMLADVSEAVTHSMRDPSTEEVETAIRNVLKARWDDGQFTESGLTDIELDKVRQAFVRVWRTLHHDRLKYPSTTTGRMPVPPSMAGAEDNGSSTQVCGSPELSDAEQGAPVSNEAARVPNASVTTSTTPVLPPGADCC
jgi:putative nucleotidyltransferase with HDIG domain